MVMLFGKKQDYSSGDFLYLSEDAVYLDSACQSLRPQPVIDALNQYYTEFNSCGERVKYRWGVLTDERVNETRDLVLKYFKLKSKDYFVSFTLNTTYGINLILNQLKLHNCHCEKRNDEAIQCDDCKKTGSPRPTPVGDGTRDDGELLIKKVVTSDIEHNSPFLATMAFSRKNNIPREVMTRNDDGSIDIDKYDFTQALVVVNSASNIDGRKLKNLDELVKKVHNQGGIIIVDAAQGAAQASEMLENTTADAICFSAHKMYAPSLGVMVIRRNMLDKVDTNFIGGGMVDDADRDEFVLSANSPNHEYTKFEPGLQAWGEIIALGAAIKWLTNAKKQSKLPELSQKLYDFLKSAPKIHLINAEPTSTFAFYHENIDSHLLSEALSDQGIMTRSGYFCCHYYLDHVKHYPPLVRVSLGLHNCESDIDKLIEALQKVTR